MATFYEFKKIIGRMFGCRNIEENENDIGVSIQNRHYLGGSSDITDFTISNSELKELYDRTMSKSNENLELYSTNYYEVAIDFDYPLVRREHYPVISDDTTNGIKYILGFPTMEYCAFLLISIVDINNRQNSLHYLYKIFCHE